jgi:hypothetical protein
MQKTKVAQQRSVSIRVLKASKEVLTKKQVMSKIKEIKSNADIIKSIKSKSIPIPTKPKKPIDTSLGDITKLSPQALGKKYAEFVEYSEYIAYETALADVDDMVDETIYDHTFAVVMLEDIIQDLSSREDREAAVKSHRDVLRASMEDVNSFKKATLMKAIFNSLIKKVDALSREITRRGLGSEQHYRRLNRTM